MGFIILFLIIFILLFPNVMINSIRMSLKLWTLEIFPSLFLFFILIDLLSKSKISTLISRILYIPFRKVFNISSLESSFIIIMSLIAGNPGSIILIKNMYQEKYIGKNEANYLLKFCALPSPIFVIYFVGINTFNSFRLGLCIYLSIILCNIIIAFIFKPKIDIKNIHLKKKDLSIEDLCFSIEKNLKVLFFILGTMIIGGFLIEIFHFFNIMFLDGFIEYSIGIANINFYGDDFKILFVLAFLCFTGLSIHFQVYSIIKNDLSYLSYLIGRLIALILSIIVFFLIYCLFP